MKHDKRLAQETRSTAVKQRRVPEAVSIRPAENKQARGLVRVALVDLAPPPVTNQLVPAVSPSPHFTSLHLTFSNLDFSVEGHSSALLLRYSTVPLDRVSAKAAILPPSLPDKPGRGDVVALVHGGV